MKAMSVLYEEIAKYKKWDEGDDYEAKLTLLRKKFRQLMNNILLRNTKDYYKNKTSEIPDEDVEIVKKLLIMSVDGEGENKICKKWFNGKLKYNDYKDRATLYDTLVALLDELLTSGNIQNGTYKRWLLSFDTILYGNTSKQILSLYSNIDDLVTATIGLNQYVNLPDISTETAEVFRKLLPTPPPELNDDITKISLNQLVDYFSCQEEFFSNLNNIVEYLALEAKEKNRKIIEILIAYIIDKDKYINDKAVNSNLAYEGLNFIDQQYLFLMNNKDILKQIGEDLSLPEEVILKMFKFINRDKN